MLRRIGLIVLVALLGLTPLQVQADPVDDLATALQLPWLFRILAEEGRDFGADLDADLFAGDGGPRWLTVVADIHDPQRMEKIAMARLRRELAATPEMVVRLQQYFASDAGARIVHLELAAREAMLDDDLTAAAEAARVRAMAQGGPRLDLLKQLIAIDDLIEQNVAGSLNSNLAFSRGLLADGAAAVVDEGELLAGIWQQEEHIRADTTDWLFAYLLLAYDPLSDAELAAHIDFSASADGRRLSRALFAAFGGLFDQLAHELGQAAGRFGRGHDL